MVCDDPLFCFVYNAGGQSPPTPEPGQTVSNKDFSKEYPSMGAGAGEIVEQGN